MEGYVEVAEPVGVVAGVTPVTNPTSTTMFKSIICAKTRNPIIFAFHPSAQQCSKEAARLLRDAAIKSGAPKYCIQWIETPSLEATNALMKHNGVSLILATGGAGMVKAAYSAGKAGVRRRSRVTFLAILTKTSILIVLAPTSLFQKPLTTV
jgi:acetaldehyde dehydrogenase/alcohol dehydrogenase